MHLADRVGYWDKGPEAIGEDCHMFLKCLFKTNGEARMETIHVPIGCYNICADTWFGSLKARYDQMYRHLWATIDIAYTVQQSIVMKDMPVSLKLWAFYEMFKVRIFPPTITWILAIVPRIMMWCFPVYQEEPLLRIMQFLGNVQILLFIPYVVTSVYFEILHRHIVNQAIERGTALPSQRRRMYHMVVDWLLSPLVSIVFYSLCSLHVQFRQFFSDHVNYKVAAKPANLSYKPLEEVVSTSPFEPYAGM